MKHQKRLSAPRHYPISRKDGTYVIAGDGPHTEADGIPVTVLLRDVLGYADTAAEARQILNEGNVTVNGHDVSRPSQTIGFMDVISIAKIDKHFRVLKDSRGLVFKEIDDPEKRLYRVEDKTTLKGGITQLNLDGGVNMETEDEYKTRGSLLVNLEDGEIVRELPMEEGALAYIAGGRHAGKMATIDSIEIVRGPQANRVTLSQEKDTFETVEDYVFVIGEDEPEVEV